MTSADFVKSSGPALFYSVPADRWKTSNVFPFGCSAVSSHMDLGNRCSLREKARRVDHNTLISHDVVKTNLVYRHTPPMRSTHPQLPQVIVQAPLPPLSAMTQGRFPSLGTGDDERVDDRIHL